MKQRDEAGDNAIANSLTVGLRWVARVLSIASVALILLFLVGEGLQVEALTAKEWVSLLFFPLGVVVGMIVGWWHDGIGGGIAVGSLLAFYGIQGLLLNGSFPRGWAFVAFSLPGILFLVCWLLSVVVQSKSVGRGT